MIELSEFEAYKKIVKTWGGFMEKCVHIDLVLATIDLWVNTHERLYVNFFAV